ncbi:RecB family exonuclease [Streptomyces sp. NPDC004284]|uniref:RecB family exonuclease n=1 Tax=Streptomyces sp. NPDC004284 TaxID=3364695 RepID=UPI003677FD2A
MQPIDTSGAPAPPAALRPAAPPSSLSPSRAGDFTRCPLLHRFRAIDRLPEKPNAAARGVPAHAVPERLFDVPAAERTAVRARAVVAGARERPVAARPEPAESFARDGRAPASDRGAEWPATAERLVERWSTPEDPARLEPAEREPSVTTTLDSGLRPRGIIDRVDVAPTGEVRIVDHETGRAPRPACAADAPFQPEFYALVLWRPVCPGSGDVLTHDPAEGDPRAVERELPVLGDAIGRATRTGDRPPRPSRLCGRCPRRALCPAWGGTPPPYPLPVTDPAAGEGERPAADAG